MKTTMKNIIFALSCVAFALTSVSCESELGALPENAKVDGNTVLDAATAKIALNGVYFRFAGVEPTDNTTQGWKQNERFPSMMAGHMQYGFGIGAGSPELNQVADYGETYWLYAYRIINAANSLIVGMDALPAGRISAADRAPIEGEARFLRAYGHFKLLAYYGQWFDYSSSLGVLLRDEPVTTENMDKARSTVAESYTAILSDLDYAIEHCPPQNTKHYANSWAAKALKARVLMCRQQAGDYTEVIRLTDEIINQGAYQLEPLAKDIFRTKGASSSEVILSISPQPNQPAYPYNRTRQFYPGASSLYCATPAFKDLLEGDPRQAWMIGPYRPNYINYFFLKYIAQGEQPTQVSETHYAIRLTEIYLLKAEAILRSNGDIEDAKSILRTIGSHNGLTDFTALNALTNREDILLYNYYETSKSMVSEDGQEWLCLLRLPLTQITAIRPSLTNTIQYILPVPDSEFQNNALFGDQNPGYGINI